MLGREHPKAATNWLRAVQTPRVFLTDLEASAWWEPSRFGVSARLEAAWAAGEIAADLKRIDEVERAAAAERAAAERAAQDSPPGAASFQRIVSSGAPIRGASGDDADLAGVWSEFMLFNGTDWLAERCAAARSLCAQLQASPEVAGDVVGTDGSLIPPQGQVTIFRLRPGAHVLPHVGVTNRRLVLQFPLRGWHP